MATSSYDSVFRIGCTTIAIPVGLTSNAVYFGVEPYLMSSSIEYNSGGTLVVMGVNYGQTLAAASLAVTPFHYVDPTNAISINGPACFYVASLSATCVVSIQRNYSQGASFNP